jgi:hypothetical protein
MYMQDDVHRQDVKERRLKAQQQGLHDSNMRLVQKIRDAHFIVVHRVFESCCRI